MLFAGNYGADVFDPRSLSPIIWLNAMPGMVRVNGAVVNNSAVTGFYDLTHNKNDFLSTNGVVLCQYNTKQINGYGCFNAASAGCSIQNGSSTLPTDFLHNGTISYTAFMFINLNANFGATNYFSTTDSTQATAGIAWYWDGTNMHYNIQVNAYSLSFAYTPPLAANGWDLHAVTFDKTNAKLTYYVNGVQKAQVSQTNAPQNVVANNPLRLGEMVNNSGKDGLPTIQGLFKEAIFIKSLLSSTQLTQMTHNYFSAVYNLGL